MAKAINVSDLFLGPSNDYYAINPATGKPELAYQWVGPLDNEGGSNPVKFYLESDRPSDTTRYTYRRNPGTLGDYIPAALGSLATYGIGGELAGGTAATGAGVSDAAASMIADQAAAGSAGAGAAGAGAAEAAAAAQAMENIGLADASGGALTTAGGEVVSSSIGSQILSGLNDAVTQVKNFVSGGITDAVSAAQKVLGLDSSAVQTANQAAETAGHGLSEYAVDATASAAPGAPAATSSNGIIDKFLKFGKEYPWAVTGAVNLAGGALSHLGKLSQIEKEREEKEKLAQFNRAQTQAGSYFSAKNPLSTGSGVAMRNGQPLWQNGIINRRIG